VPGLSADPERAAAVKRAFVFPWDDYKRHAWGYDFLRPLSRTDTNMFSGGLTITDSIDTILIIGLDDEYRLARSGSRTTSR